MQKKRVNTQKKYIEIQLEKSNYFAGEELKGMVIVNLPNSSEYNQILMKVKGVEVYQIYNQQIPKRGTQLTLENNTAQINSKSYNNQFYDYCQILKDYSKEPFEKGKYEFNINFSLESELPSSTYKKDKNYLLSIIYYIKIECLSEQENIPPYKQKEEFIVKQMNFDDSFQKESYCKARQGLFSSKQNISAISCELNKTTFDEGEEAVLSVTVDNSQSNQDLVQLQINLITIVIIKDPQGKEKVYQEKKRIVKIDRIKSQTKKEYENIQCRVDQPTTNSVSIQVNSFILIRAKLLKP